MSDFYQASEQAQIDALRHLAFDALRQYDGRFTPPELVKYRENAIFSTRDEQGNRFALRIHRPNYHTDGALASELAWMQSLADHGLPVPALRLNRMNEAITLAGGPRVPEVRRVDLISWVSGEPLSRIEEERAVAPETRALIYRRIGTLMAQLHDHGSQWSRDRDVERPSWFVDALVGDEPLWGRFWELPLLTADQRQTMLEARDEGRAALASYPIHAGNSGLIHADLIADNMMVNADIISPIDFDDAGFGWHMFDIATTLYFVCDRPDFAELRDAMIGGYREVRDLPEGELASLPLFLMLRGTTYLGWISTRSETATARDLAPLLIGRAFCAWEDYCRSR